MNKGVPEFFPGEGALVEGVRASTCLSRTLTAQIKLEKLKREPTQKPRKGKE